MRDVKLTNHAIHRYKYRTGKDSVLDTYTYLRLGLENSYTLTEEQVRKSGFSIVPRSKDDKYFVWYDPTIKEFICGVVSKDNALKTVLTKGLYSWCNKKLKIRRQLNVRRQL
jgi:hypothetical protein